QPHPTVANMDLQPIAVMLQFVRPAWFAWRLASDDMTTKNNESGGRVSRPTAPPDLRTHCDSQIVSYKKHVKEYGVNGARVVCFHGKRRPRDINRTLPYWTAGVNDRIHRHSFFCVTS